MGMPSALSLSRFDKDQDSSNAVALCIQEIYVYIKGFITYDNLSVGRLDEMNEALPSSLDNSA